MYICTFSFSLTVYLLLLLFYSSFYSFFNCVLSNFPARFFLIPILIMKRFQMQVGIIEVIFNCIVFWKQFCNVWLDKQSHIHERAKTDPTIIFPWKHLARRVGMVTVSSYYNKSFSSSASGISTFHIYPWHHKIHPFILSYAWNHTVYITIHLKTTDHKCKQCHSAFYTP